MGRTHAVVAALALSFVLVGCGQGQQPGNQQVAACRMNSVTIDPETVTHDNLTQCGAAEYAAACDEGVTKEDATCGTQCALYKKRAAAPATGADCAANPVQATSAAFKDQCEKYLDGDAQKFRVTCKVSATCTCDP